MTLLAGQGSKHRGKMEIVTDMLQFMPCRKSHLMFGARLTHQRMEEYLDVLVEKGLCEFRSPERMYFRTERGDSFLWHARQLELVIR